MPPMEFPVTGPHKAAPALAIKIQPVLGAGTDSRNQAAVAATVSNAAKAE